VDKLTPSLLAKAFRGELVPPAGRQAGKTPDTLPSPRPGVWFVYVIECEDGSFYKGFTEDLPRRWKQHVTGTAAEWTRRHRPKQVFYWEECCSEADAVAREQYLKSGIGREWFKREVVDQAEAWEPAEKLLQKIKKQKE
jgi:type I restriction enzyme S subunit